MSAAARAGALASQHALWIVVAVGALLRFGTLASQGFWFDESFTVELVQRRPGDLLSGLAATEANPPLYYLVALGWERLFGDGEVGLRSLSALAGTATIPVVYAAARSLGSRAAALIAAGLTAASPLLIWYSQEARSYSLALLLSALAFLCFARQLAGGGDRWLWGWALASILALSTHYLTGVLTVVEAGWLWRAARGRRFDVALASATIAAAAVALLPLALAQGGHADWIGLLGRAERLWATPQHLLVGLSAPWRALGPVAVALVALVCLLAARRLGDDNRRLAIVAGAIAALGAIAFVVAALVGSDYLITRNLLALWIPVAIALGALLGSARTIGFGAPVAALLCALGAGLAIWTAATPAAGRPDWEPVLAELGRPTGPRLILTQSLASSIGLYLDDAAAVGPGARVTTAEVEVIDLLPIDDYAIGPCWWTGFCGGRRALGSSALPIDLPPEFELVDEARTEIFTVRRYQAPHPVTLPPFASLRGAYVQSPQ